MPRGSFSERNICNYFYDMGAGNIFSHVVYNFSEPTWNRHTSVPKSNVGIHLLKFLSKTVFVIELKIKLSAHFVLTYIVLSTEIEHRKWQGKKDYFPSCNSCNEMQSSDHCPVWPLHSGQISC